MIDRRTVATPTAMRAAMDMRSLLQGPLTQDTRQIARALDTLCDPNLWDGPSAQAFRQAYAPRIRAALQGEIQSLELLDGHIERVLQDIFKAGAEGTASGGPGGPPGPAGPGLWGGVWDGLRDYSRGIGVAKFGLTYAAVAQWYRASQAFPGTAQRLFSEAVAPTAAAYDRGEASLAELESAARLGMTRIDALKAFSVNQAMQNVQDGGQQFLGAAGGGYRLLARAGTVIGVAGDVATMAGILHQGHQTADDWVTFGASSANLVGSAGVMTGWATGAGLLTLNASLDWIPVAGQVIAVTTGLFLAADWAYHTFKPFHDVVDTAWHDITSIF